MMGPGQEKIMGNVVYLSHGGGPLPLLGDPGHQKMVRFMKDLPSHFESPEAVIIISAHWEENVAKVTSSAQPPLLYDYYGFPHETYQVTYPVPGNPALAEQVVSLLEGNGIPSAAEPSRGLDHGAFIPMKLSYPDASIPTIQLSLIKGLDPALHFDLGTALRPLLERNVLFIGSGFSFHNMRAFNWQGENPPDEKNEAFQNHLIDTYTRQHTSQERKSAVLEWEEAPHARYCHPREEHLLPLFVCAGLSDKPGNLIFNDYIMGKRSIAIRW